MDARTSPAAPPSVQAAPSAAASKPRSGALRRRLFALLGAGLVIAAVIFGLYWFLVASQYVGTDDAYVDANVAQVTPLVSGPVVSAPVHETQPVRQGDVLVVIDPTDFRLAVAQAQAALGQAERKVQGYFADTQMQAATTTARGADIERARAQLASARDDLARATVDLTRRQALAASGAVSGDELTAAQNRFGQTREAVAAAQAAVAQALANKVAAVGQEKAASVLVAGAGVSDNPEVALARAKLQQAQLDLQRTVVRAPMDGVVAKDVVEVGQRVPAGQQLMTIVPIESAYVNANFKEAQLRRVRIGQAATLKSDLYGGGVTFHGRVEGVAGGTGSAFAIIPAQNATGNWIKVVQRLPLRIALDRRELERHPLRVGSSMKVDIDISR